MCETCGCSDGAKVTVVGLHSHSHSHGHHHSDRHDDFHDHKHVHPHSSTVELQQAVLAKNDALAERNRSWFAGREILALNLLSAPGAGKTTLLERTVRDLANTHPFFVIEGDQATSRDGERIRAAGAPVVQINTGSGCHLDADMIARGLAELRPAVGSIVMIENVGNLVCPALFDLGENAKIVITSVTEGEDKPIKYPNIFQAAKLLIINKIDLLPHVGFDLDLCRNYAWQVNPSLEIMTVSAVTGEGIKNWHDWLHTAVHFARFGGTPRRSGVTFRAADTLGASQK